MKKIRVKVKEDHLDRVARVKKPIVALAELIWNGLDADASRVEVTFAEGGLGALEAITVSDNGHGMPFDETVKMFGSLGGSWKCQGKRTQEGCRMMHGRNGKGRFRAFHLGEKVTWRSRTSDNGSLTEFSIKGRGSKKGVFKVSDPVQSDAKGTGTVVEIQDLSKKFPSLRGNDPLQWITEQFALYMIQYSDIEILYDGTCINPRDAQMSVREYVLDPISLESGETVEATLVIIEWKSETERKFYLCDNDGFALSETQTGIHAPGLNFTAHLKSEYFRRFEEDDNLEIGELHPGIKAVTDAARVQLRIYYKEKSVDKAGRLVRRWKEDKIYPYHGAPEDLLADSERRLFDMCAVSVFQANNDLDHLRLPGQRLTLRLLKEALSTSPSLMRKILEEVVGLPKKRIDELAEMLEKTSLDAIIRTAKTIANRLSFINGLEQILHDRDKRQFLLERSQLHRILVEELWIFGDEYSLGSDDVSLKNVLRNHLKILGLPDLENQLPEDNINDLRDIPDLVLWRQYSRGRADEFEHLVIELKRPSKNISLENKQQVERYAARISNNTYFDRERTHWTFVVVGDALSEDVKALVQQKNRKLGHVAEASNFDIWVKTWKEIIHEAKIRHRFLKEKLDYSVDSNTEGIAYLRSKYAAMLPEEIIGVS